MKKERREEKKTLQKMTLLDRFLFREVADDAELFGILVDILFERHIEFLDMPQTEKEFGISPQLRSIRLDVFNLDTDKQIYTLEMQAEDTRNLKKRSRLYQAQLDVTLLPPGSIDFNKMNNVYLIMICPFDLFGKGACRYTFQEICEEYPDLRLKDGGCRMFINTRGKNRHEFSREFVELMDYINASAEEAEKYTTTEPLKRLHEGIQKLKQLERTGIRYMQRWEERVYDRMEAKKEGREEGREEGISIVIKMIKNAIDTLGLSLDKACELAGITVENYNEYLQIYNKHECQ